jgi:glycosyltransferase involved in cell wall biosynthesis
MRIGFFTYGMGQRLTGIGRYAVELTRNLRRLEPGLEIVLLNPNPRSKLEWYQEFETYSLPSLELVPAAATLGNLVLHQAARRLKLDILHDPCGIAPFVWPREGFRRVVTVHDAIPLATPEVQPLATRLIFRTLVPWSRWSADAILTVSQHAAADLRKYARLPAHKLHVTPNGAYPPPTLRPDEIELELHKLGLERPFFLYVGALTPRKNLSRVLGAFAQFRAEFPKPRLAIVGPVTWGGEEVTQRKTEGVTLTGYVSERALHALYYSATALVFPSLYEGFGLPALEAMHHGTPVIAANTSSFPEVMGNVGLLVDPTSEEAIAEALRRYWASPTLREEQRQLGLERAKQFSWEQTARKTLDVYRGLG